MATIHGAGSANVIVNQSSNSAIINWNTFNIGLGQTTTFNQPGSMSVMLNRVIGGLGPSVILGTLNANGRVFVINRDGVLFGPNSVVNTAGFLASTNDIKNSDFMAGRYNFNIPGRPDASIVNQGHITATSGGFAALVAPGVRNSGTISATLGTVALAAGNSFTLDLYGDKLVNLAVGDQIAGQVIDVQTGQTLKSLVTNDGKIKANGGRVELTAAAARHVVNSVINTSGVISANSIGTHNGMIVLGAATGGSKPAGAPKQTIKLAGRITAAGKKVGTTGGTIVVTGEDIQVASATINASGQAGGGTVMLGGDWGGGNPNSSLVSNQSARLAGFAVPNATTLSVDGATTIDASAKDNGNGGKVVLWSDAQTTFAGTIFAQGGVNGGNGGFVETSSHGVLNFTGSVDTSAPNGTAGTLLLDPENYYINTNGTAPGVDSTASAISVSTLQSQLANGNVVIATLSTGSHLGDIEVQDSVSWTGANSLTLSAHHNIQIDHEVTITNIGGGNLNLRADSTGAGTGTVIFNPYCDCSRPDGAVDFSKSTGTVSIYYDPTHPLTFGGNKYQTPTDFSPYVTGQLTSYMLVNNATDLQNISTNLAGTYALGKDFSATSFTGFPVGMTFAGLFDGNGGLGVNSTISNLTLSGASSPLGLFPFIGTKGTVRNLKLADVSITAGANTMFIGPLAGENDGMVSNVSVLIGSTGSTVNGGTFTGIGAGGLVGQNKGTITGSSSAAAVIVGDALMNSNNNIAGGLAGTNFGTISGSSASGTVYGGNFSFVGGLVGINGGGNTNASISNSSAIGSVSSNYIAGGLVGANFVSSGTTSTITGSQASGDVALTGAGGGTAGGLVGQNEGSIASSTYSNGTVSGSGAANNNFANIGGLVGINGTSNTSAATITNSQVVKATVTGGNFTSTGGLVGNNGFNGAGGSIANSTSSGWVSAGVDSLVGGLVGRNDGPVTDSSSSMAVSGVSGHALGNNDPDFGSGIGGLVGQNFALISNSSATGPVTGTGDVNFPNAAAIIGGLVGLNNNPGQITGSQATGVVTGTGQVQVGGLVGSNQGQIANSSATGLVGGATTGASNNFITVGGLVGSNQDGGTITSSDATGAVIGAGNAMVGGLAGANSGAITLSHAEGDVIFISIASGNGFANFAGGLVGQSGNGGTPAPNATITIVLRDRQRDRCEHDIEHRASPSADWSATILGSTITNSQAFGTVTAFTFPDSDLSANVAGWSATIRERSSVRPLSRIRRAARPAHRSLVPPVSVIVGPTPRRGIDRRQQWNDLQSLRDWKCHWGRWQPRGRSGWNERRADQRFFRFGQRDRGRQ